MELYDLPDGKSITRSFMKKPSYFFVNTKDLPSGLNDTELT